MNVYNQNDQVLLEKLTETILSNIRDENFGPVELSVATGLSQKKIRVILKSLTDKTISQFIREVRLKKAYEIISSEDITAAEVAYKTGFSSPTYFNTCFHELFGFPPGEVRKRKLLNNNKQVTDPNDIQSYLTYPKKKYSIFPNKRLLITLSLSIFIILMGIASYFLRIKSVKGNNKEISIAVLPFKNLSINQEDQYFIDGIMEEILTNLSGIKKLRVLSRTSVEQFRETILTASEIGKILDADYLVEGSGQKLGNIFLLRIQLIAVENERHIWAETYEREIKETKDIFDIQSEVSRRIAGELKISLTPEEKQAMDKIPTTSLTAYDYYLKGFNECYYNQNYDRAEVLFKKALALDSTFSYAYSGLFIVYKFRHYYSSFYDADYMDSLLILTNKALEFDNNYWPGYLGRGEYYSITGRQDQTIKECLRSLEINQDYWVTYYVLATIFLWNNYHADYLTALQYYQKAADAERGEQLSTTLYWIGIIYGNFAGFPKFARRYLNDAFDLKNDTTEFLNHTAYFEMVNGNFDKAVELAQMSYAGNKNNREALRVLGLAYLFKRQYPESLTYFRKYAEILEKQGEFQTGSMVPIGFAYQQNGYPAEAEKWYSEQQRFSEASLKYGRWYSAWGFADLDLGIMYSLKGDRENALKHLRVFSDIKVCPLFLITDMKYSPVYDNLRNDPEFKVIFHKMESKYIAEHNRIGELLRTDQ